MKILSKLTLFFALSLCLGLQTVNATTVTLSRIPNSCTITMIKKGGDTPIDLGEMIEHKHTVDCEPGVYTLSFNNEGEDCGSLEVEVFSPEKYSSSGGILEIPFTSADITVRNSSTNDKFIKDLDYTVDIDVFDQDGKEMFLSPVLSETGIRYFYPIDWKSHITITPTEIHPDYPLTNYWRTSGSTDDSIIRLYKGTEIYLSFPSDAEGGLFQKQGTIHYVPFVELTPQSVETENGITTKTYFIPCSNEKYSYRVSREGSLTNAGLISPFYDTDINISEDDLQLVSPLWQTHNLIDGTNYAELYLNINQRGHLRLKPGDDYQIVNLRTWQLTNSVTENYFIEPDFHYTVLDSEFRPDESVISIDDNGKITANNKGTAIVEITYDAINFPSAYGHALWSALWAENTGTFVVTVDDDAAVLPDDNIHLGYKPDAPLDSEHDILYYLSGQDGYELTFAPESGSTVTVATPVVDSDNNTVSYPKGFSTDNVTVAADGSVKVLLTFGRNIIRTTNTAGKSNYQVLSAKPVTREISTNRDDDYILPGDSVTVQHSGLFHLAGKLAGIYNQSCYLTFDGEACYPLQQLAPWQYNFAGNKQGQAYIVKAPASAAEPMSLSNGALYHYGYGSLPGSHRAVNYGRGVDPNLKAEVRSAYCGSVPDAQFETTPMANGMKLNKRLSVNSGFTVLSNDAFTEVAGGEPVWTSADPEIAKVNEKGYVTALKEGKTTVNVSNTDKSFSIDCAVDVYTQLPDTIYFNRPSFSSTVSENSPSATVRNVLLQYMPSNAVIDPDDVIVTVENENIASLIKNKAPFSYKLNIKGPGKTFMTAVCEKLGLSAKAEIMVDMRATSITLSNTELEVGQNYLMTPTFLPETTTLKKVTWSSSNPVVATVSNKGVITARSSGTTEISVTDNRIEGKCMVTVKQTPTGIYDIATEIDDEEVETYYNLQGIASDRPFEGLNLVKFKNGTTRKIFIK